MGSRMVSFPINMLLVGTPKLMNYYWLSITISPAAIRVPTMIEVFQRLHTSFRIKHCSPVTCSYSLTGFFSYCSLPYASYSRHTGPLASLRNGRHTPVSGPLHLLSLCLESLYFKQTSGLLPSFIRSLLKCTFS